MPRTLHDDRAIVLFSGGQDSTTCLAWALERFARVDTIGFDYGQRHRVELECRESVLDRLRKEFPGWQRHLGDHHLIDLGFLREISETALTRDESIAITEDGLPSTFVPGRNLLFLATAAAVAYRLGTRHLVGGMCETDYAGYPDCRDDTLKSLQVAIGLGMDARFVIDTPLMWLDKAQTFAMAEALGGRALVELIIEETHTCYHGDRGRRHDWGYGCDECPACALRAAGWRRYAHGSPEPDPRARVIGSERSGPGEPAGVTADCGRAEVNARDGIRVSRARLRSEGWAYLASFIACIPAANWLIGNAGTVCVPDGPCLVPVAPGLMAPSGVLMIGLALVLRDLVQRRLGRWWAVTAIGAGAALSALLAPAPLVVASGTAFALSELVDFAVYTPLQARRLVLAVLLSGAAGLVIDSLVFLWLAFGSLEFLAGQVVGKSWMVLGALPFIRWLRDADERRGIHPA